MNRRSLLCGGAAAATGAVVWGAVPPLTAYAADPPDVERVVHIDELTESSGLAVSGTHSGILWSHNDSGDSARIFAIAPDGRAAATVELSGVESMDAEAIARLRVPSSAGAATPGTVLIFADIGDNDAVRTGEDDAAPLPELVVIPEPDDLRDQSVPPATRIRLRYPDGAQDAETLLADPRDGRLYVVTKGLLGGRLYAVPPEVWPGTNGEVASRAARGDGPDDPVEATLTPMASIPVPLATDGAIAPDGSIIVRGYGSASVFPPAEELSGGAGRASASLTLPPQEQGESLTLDPEDSGSILVGSEGLDQPIYRVALPAADPSDPLAQMPTPSANATPSPSASGPAGATAGENDESKSEDDDPASAVLTRAGLAAVGLAAAGLGLAGLIARRRRRALRGRHGSS